MSRAGLQAIVEPVVAGLGYEFVGLERSGGRKHEVVRIYIDHAEGITVDDCEAVSQQVGAVLDVEDPIHGHYTLEVSSPGLDRPLFTPDQYRRFVGAEVNVRLRHLLKDRRKLQGKLTGVAADGFDLEVDGAVWQVPFASVERARVVPQWPEHPRPAGQKRH
jgi:ribosome maturation factor RimP